MTSEERNRIAEEMKRLFKELFTDQFHKELCDDAARMVFEHAEGKVEIAPLLGIVLDRDGAPGNLKNSPLGEKWPCLLQPIFPGQHFHRNLHDMGETFDGKAIAAILISEVWYISRDKGAAREEPRKASDRREAICVSVQTLDGRCLCRRRDIERVQGNIHLAAEPAMDGVNFSSNALNAFFIGYAKRLLAKRGETMN